MSTIQLASEEWVESQLSGFTSTIIENDLTGTTIGKALDATQGKILKALINGLPPMNFSLFKSGANGLIPATSFSWVYNLTVTQVILQDFASDISATISGTTYNKTTLIGIPLSSGTKMTNLDLTI